MGQLHPSSTILRTKLTTMVATQTVRVACVCLFSAVGSFLFGLDMGYIGPIVEDRQFIHDVGHSAELKSSTSGLIVSVFALGCMFSAFPLLSSFFLDSLGRKVSIMFGSVVFLAGCVIQAVASNVSTMVVGRFVAGCSIGILSTVVPLYQSEIAPPKLRGAMTSLSQVMIVFGVAVASFADEVLLPLENGWRYAVLLPVAPGLLLLVGMVFMPRSPRWLVQHGRSDAALRVLKSVREDEKEATAEFDEIVADQEQFNQAGNTHWCELFSRRARRLLVIGMVLQLLQQLTGINLFVSFGPRLFKILGYDANLCQTLMTLTLFFATLPAICLIDRFGRRSLLLAGAIGMLLANVVVAILGLSYARLEDGRIHVLDNTAGTFVAVASFFSVASFAPTWGPVTWVYCAEIFPLRVRGRCIGLTTMAEWLGVFLVNQFSPMLLSSIGFGTFLVFTMFSVAALLLSLWLPETKGILLEHMEHVFDKKLGIGDTVGMKESGSSESEFTASMEAGNSC